MVIDRDKMVVKVYNETEYREALDFFEMCEPDVEGWTVEKNFPPDQQYQEKP